MLRWRHSAARCLFLAFAMVAVFLDRSGQAASVGQADSTVNVAGIVVDYGDGQVSYALVPFGEESISGIDALERSGLSLLTVEFGGMGMAVCVIEDTGCDLGACRARLCQTGDPESPFWQYAQQPTGGEWQVAPLGASSSTIEDGDVDGWFWTGSVPAPEPVPLEAIAGEVGIDLDTFRENMDGSLEPLSVTIGGDADDPILERWEAVAGTIVIGAVAAVGAFAVLRARRHPSR